MSTRATEVSFEIHLDDSTLSQQLLEDARRCRDGAMELPSRWFYDERGCALFDAITELEEYYPTRREREILFERASEIAEVTNASSLIELGAGSSEKTGVLLDALASSLERYVPLDVSLAYLRASAPEVASRYGIDVLAIIGDFERHLEHLPIEPTSIVAFLGSTIGNLDAAGRHRFLHTLAAAAPADSWLLLGVDLVKDPTRLVAAYDDPTGVTAAFNRNIVDVLNHELDTTFDVDAFAHVALWNAVDDRIEMWLRATRAQRTLLDGQPWIIDAGQAIRTEISCKFRRDGITTELADAGYRVERWWTDPAGDVALTLARRI